MDDGGDISKAKFYSNAIGPALLDIPLDKVLVHRVAEILMYKHTNRFASPDSTSPLGFSIGSGLFWRMHVLSLIVSWQR